MLITSFEGIAPRVHQYNYGDDIVGSETDVPTATDDNLNNDSTSSTESDSNSSDVPVADDSTCPRRSGRQSKPTDFLIHSPQFQT